MNTTNNNRRAVLTELGLASLMYQADQIAGATCRSYDRTIEVIEAIEEQATEMLRAGTLHADRLDPDVLCEMHGPHSGMIRIPTEVFEVVECDGYD